MQYFKSMWVNAHPLAFAIIAMVSLSACTEDSKFSSGVISSNNENSCSFNGVKIPDGGSVRAFQSSTVPVGQTCVQEQRYCSRGSLSGTFENSNCTVSNVTPTTIPGAGAVAAKGQILGSCLYQYGSDFKPTTVPTADSIVWPMVSCNSAGTATCASGFSVIDDTPIQMNCSSNPSAEFSPCYWSTKRCARTTGSTEATAFVKGQNYGGCLMKFNENFQPSQAAVSVVWPMLSCDMTGKATCAAGFATMNETPVQMNCSSTPSNTNTSNCYWMTVRCVKQ